MRGERAREGKILKEKNLERKKDQTETGWLAVFNCPRFRSASVFLSHLLSLDNRSPTCPAPSTWLLTSLFVWSFFLFTGGCYYQLWPLWTSSTLVPPLFRLRTPPSLAPTTQACSCLAVTASPASHSSSLFLAGQPFSHCVCCGASVCLRCTSRHLKAPRFSVVATFA